MFRDAVDAIFIFVGVGATIWAAIVLIVGRNRYKRLQGQFNTDRRYYLRRLVGQEIGAASLIAISLGSLGMLNHEIPFGLAVALLSLGVALLWTMIFVLLSAEHIRLRQ